MLHTSKFSDYDVLLYFCGPQGNMPGHQPGSIVRAYRVAMVPKDMSQEDMMTLAPKNTGGIFGNPITYN